MKALAIVIGIVLVGPLLLFIALVTDIILIIEGVVTAIANFINWLVNLGKNAYQIAVNIGRWFIDLGEQIKNSIYDAVVSVGRWFLNLEGIILNSIGNAGSWLYNTGQKIIGGLINGIQSYIGGIGSAIGNIANNISNSVSGALHNIHVPGFATGTNFAPGGWSMVHKDELVKLPVGTQVKTASQSSSMGAPSNGGTTTVTIGTVVLQTPAAAQEFFRQLNQDTMNLGKGLTAVQGNY